MPESERNGNITHYEIVYTPLSMVLAIEESPTTVTTDGPVLSRLLQGLEEYTTYSVSVRAVSIVGSGPLSPPVIDQTLEDGKVPKHTNFPLLVQTGNGSKWLNETTTTNFNDDDVPNV